MLRGGWWRRTDRAGAADAALALTLLAIGQSEVWVPFRLGGIGTAVADSRPLAALMIVVCTLPLAWRRSRPLVVAFVVCAALATQVLVVVPSVSLAAGLLPLMIVDYSGAAYGRAHRRGSVLVAVLGVEAVLVARIAEERVPGEFLFGLFVIIGVWVIGDLVRSRQHRADQAVEDVARVEAERDVWAAQVLAEERVRIARELHDIIAHGVSLMGVQAAAARVLIDRDPDAAKQTLRIVEAQGRESVGELQRLLGVLREPNSCDDLQPQPGLSDVPALVEQLRQAGKPVELSIQGQPRTVPAGIDLAAYRVVQEALTNSLKHAGSVPARVCVSYERATVAVHVSDHGPLIAGPVLSGHGLIGMRERIALYGGSLQFGPDTSGQFSVQAQLPLNGEQA